MTEKITYRIQDMNEDERPRERLLQYGVSALHNRELLAILLGTGTSGASALTTADEILRSKPGITSFHDIRLAELTAVKGVGTGKAATIMAAIEFGKRVHQKTSYEAVAVRDPEAVANLFAFDLRNKKKEEFWILLVDVKCKAFQKELISVGTLNQSLIHPREVFQIAIRQSARGIILVHNHPSGDPTPSPEDHQITERLVETGKIIGIDVMDHVVIGKDDYYSFRQYGMI